MSITAIAVDDANTQHLIIGLTRAEVDALVRGDVLTLPHNIKCEVNRKTRKLNARLMKHSHRQRSPTAERVASCRTLGGIPCSSTSSASHSR